LGRVINGYGEPIDGKGELVLSQSRRIDGRGVAPLQRCRIDQPIATSIRAIDGLHTCGLGQRMGIFSGPGVGKSTLISTIARHTSAEVSVVALIGERGREVQDFLANALGPQGLKKCVVVVSTSDDPPLLRVRAAKVAATISEFFRDQGKNVLLLLDSLTRLCHAQRQIGLAAGEPPATKGYPPSCFAKLPQLVERSGNGIQGVGSITAFYTVLSEGDDPQDPIADAARGILDGHIVLSRELAESGHFPAIDIERSVSRVMNSVAAPSHVEAARRFRQLHARHAKARDLIQLGAYAPGHDAELDAAVALHPAMTALLQQDMHQPATLADSLQRLRDVLAH
jgi:flagellum-specific ATP synthase